MSLQNVAGGALSRHHRRLNKAIHEFGVKVIYHSDGSVIDAVPGLIDMGIDVLQALQLSADRMDPHKLKDQYGDRLCFEGGVSVPDHAALWPHLMMCARRRST